MRVKKLWKKILFWSFFILLAAGNITVCAITAKGYQLYRTAIKEQPLSSRVEELRADEHYTSLEDMAYILPIATVAVEDRRFYSHPGVDLISITRAVFRNIKNWKLAEGGSTITQQVARTLMLSQEKKLSRKMAEVFAALALEKAYEKDEILELYLNCIYFGSNYFGVCEASMGYFGILPNALNEYEATLLIGIPNAPSVFSLDNRPELAHERQQQVLKALILYSDYSEADVARILAQKPKESWIRIPEFAA